MTLRRRHPISRIELCHQGQAPRQALPQAGLSIDRTKVPGRHGHGGGAFLCPPDHPEKRIGSDFITGRSRAARKKAYEEKSSTAYQRIIDI
jgi:hypothetical protein